MMQEEADTAAYVIPKQQPRPISLTPRDCEISISRQLDDPEWDNFLAGTSGGNYPQSSLWAQTKTSAGFRATRITVRKYGEIVGGTQILTRRLPVVGGYGYIAMGPLVASDDPEICRIVIDGINQVARDQRIHYLVIQPPWRAEALANCLRERGFFPTSRDVAPPATLLIDLTQSIDQILAQMKKAARANLRSAERKGVTVREGGEPDLGTVHRLLLATGKRHNFQSPPESYCRELWCNLGSRGFLKLFIAEFKGEPVTALFVIAFGDTAVGWRFGWSGLHGDLHPNELIEWAAMKWAKAQGYSYFDIGGINRKLARLIDEGEAIPQPMAARNHFKLQFGGKLAFYPQACAYIYNPCLRWLDHRSAPALRKAWPLRPILDLLH